ncbi:MAG TPA: metal-dependent transcriptional regulator [Bacteroidota bacterium]|nr:metal-dependent transcriptional regulator [Bacteroidota bacterium]
MPARSSERKSRDAASENIEDYLKSIYKLQESAGKVSTSSLSESLGVSPPSVTEMIKKLAEAGILTYTPYKGVVLTDEGRRRALKILRRHRLWELFLVQVLHYPWHEIHDEADRLEHLTSEKLERRIDERLGYPRKDPHGDVIPRTDGSIEEVEYRALASVPSGETVTVARVNDANSQVLQYATRLGIGLNKRIRVKEHIGFDGSLRVEIGRKEQFVSAKLAENIFVEGQ